MLHYKELKNNTVRITADSGQIKDTRVNVIYSTVVTKVKNKPYFVEVEVAT